MKVLRNITLGLGLMAAPVLPAVAAPISGTISITGQFQPVGGSVATATGVDFCNNTTGDVCQGGPPTGQFRLNSSTITGVASGDSVFGTITDFTFNPFSGPINNFLSVNGLSFDLMGLSVSQGITGPTGNEFLNIGGTGMFRLAGFDATPGTFAFTGQSDGTVTSGTFTFSGGAAATAVPVPGALALLGVGLLGMTLVRRRETA